MNSVLATGIAFVAPIKRVRLVLELAGFDFKGLAKPSLKKASAAAYIELEGEGKRAI
jgi:hypothetical protein